MPKISQKIEKQIAFSKSRNMNPASMDSGLQQLVEDEVLCKKVLEMPQKTYIESQEKLEVLEHLKLLYGPTQKQPDISEDPTYKYFVDRINMPVLDIIDEFKKRVTFFSIFNLKDEIHINRMKLKKLKKTVREIGNRKGSSEI